VTEEYSNATDALPADFVFGVATSAYQIEGATDQDGRGASIWDDFCRRPGAIIDGSDGSVATDSYRRWADDLDLIRGMGLEAYRFSVAWPRIFPQPGGQVNQRGLDHYERVVDGLLERNIAPHLTLYHWDLPLWLHELGGWTSRETAYAFADYAEAVAARLGDRVSAYATLNEPWCSAFLGYRSGEHAPGIRDHAANQAAIHHLLLAHGLAVARLRESVASQVGIVLNFTPAYPLDPTDERHQEAARRHRLVNDEVFTGPLFQGAYPTQLLDLADGAASHARKGDLETIAAPLDYLGVNYYTRTLVKDAPGAAWPALAHVEPAAGERTAMGWEVFPQGLHDLLRDLHEQSGIPLYVTENGAAFDDPAPGAANGAIVDEHRWRYLLSHIAATNEARRSGVDVRGYFAWSLLDNFEWAFGYTKDFGLVAVDAQTQIRVKKASAERFAALAAAFNMRRQVPL